MTKPNGRGRGWRRKTWDTLAPSTKKRYARYGIDEDRYGRGFHPSLWTKWVSHQQRVYGVEVEEGIYTTTVNGFTFESDLSVFDRGRLLDAIVLQMEAEKRYDRGYPQEARQIWETRDRELPEWMFFYHGMFS